VSEEGDYTPEELDGMNQWWPLAHEKLTSGKIKFYFAKFKSGSPESDALIMDPRKALTGENEEFPALKLDGVKSTTPITTTIFGHERTLNLRLRVVVAAVDDESVSLSSHKVVTPPGES
jgi:hypothetical protein